MLSASAFALHHHFPNLATLLLPLSFANVSLYRILELSFVLFDMVNNIGFVVEVCVDSVDSAIAWVIRRESSV